MHFKTLITADIPALPEDVTKNREIQDAITALEQEKKKHPERLMVQMFLEELHGKANTFGRQVYENVAECMAPYCASTEDPRYTDFVDRTEEFKNDFAQEVDCLRLAEGKIVEHRSYPYYDKYSIRKGKVYQKDAGPLHHEKRTKRAKRITVLPKYPRAKLYKSFEDYVKNHLGFDFDAEHRAYGYYYNPNAMWDGYQIGGRWPAVFLVKETCMEYSEGERSWCNKEIELPAPKGFRWVTAARKKDIEWQVMRDWRTKEATERFYRLEKMFIDGKIEDGFYGKITEDGIVDWSEFVYRRGETVDDYLERMGIPKSWRYLFHVSDIVGADNWFSQDDYREEAETGQSKLADWHPFIDTYIDNLDDDTVLVCVDCHI